MTWECDYSPAQPLTSDPILKPVAKYLVLSEVLSGRRVFFFLIQLECLGRTQKGVGNSRLCDLTSTPHLNRERACLQQIFTGEKGTEQRCLKTKSHGCSGLKLAR